MKVRMLPAAAVALAAVGGVCAMAGPGHGPGSTAGAVTAAPGRFDAPRPNPYFPLRPGTVSRYRGTDGGERFRERVVVTHRTRVVQGVTTTVVSDILRRRDGTLAERTHDWYASDNDGNVWYFGESTAAYDRRGRVDRDGSWQAGVGGARAGLIMPASPRPTDAYRQEFLRGHAEDQAWIVQTDARASVPYGRLRHLVRTFEWSRLEKGVLSLKLYAPGIGIVREMDMSGGSESFSLVSVHRR